jgi:hypothetical protein
MTVVDSPLLTTILLPLATPLLGKQDRQGLSSRTQRWRPQRTPVLLASQQWPRVPRPLTERSFQDKN